MMRPGWPGDVTPSLESLREFRVRKLLNDLVKDLGPGKLAERFGVAGAGTGEGQAPAGQAGVVALGAADADTGVVAAVDGAGAGVDVGDCDSPVSGNGPALRFL